MITLTPLIFWLITGFFVLCGFLFGVVRGMKRSILRIILIALAIVLTFMIRNVVVEKITDVTLDEETLTTAYQYVPADMQDRTVDEIITEKLPEDFASLKDIVVPLAKILVGLVLFPIVFFVLKILSWILFLILCIFVKDRPQKKLPKGTKKRDIDKDTYKKEYAPKRRRLLGGVIGLVQGLAIACVICIPLAGLVKDVAPLMSVEFKGQTVSQMINVDLTAIEDDTTVSLYAKLGKPAYEKLTTVVENEKEITLTAQLSAVKGVASMANEVMKLTEIQLDAEHFNTETIDQIKDLFANLDSIKGSMDAETLETLNNAIQGVAGSFGIDIDLSKLDLTTTSFTAEGEALTAFFEYSQGTGTKTPTELVNALAGSDLTLSFMASQGASIDVPTEDVASVTTAIDAVSDANTKAQLRQIFGITESN